tara:strand:+ start:111089 stop:112525 length:1437 start_codon:yes stop_codon:yes gene_type:complete
MVLFVMQGCSKYQKDKLPPVQRQTTETSTTKDTTLSLDEDDTTVEDSQTNTDDSEADDQTTDKPPVVVEKSLEDLLDIFFGTFVLPINKVGEAFDTRVDYERLHDLRTKKDKTFINLVTKIERKFRAADALKGKSDAYKKAFYVNAYNYFAIRLINRFYIKDGKRLKSILDLSEGFNKHQIFDARFIRVHSEELVSLNTVEKKYLSGLTNDQDGRYHFAVICVSKGCPITLNKAYREEILETQLDEVTKASLLLPRMIKHDNDDKKTYLTKLFDWYEDHFVADKGSVKAFIQHHGGDILHKVKFQKYDWTLNGLTSETVIDEDDKPELPSEEEQQGGEGSGEGADSGDEDRANPCAALIQSEQEKVISVCRNLISGKEHKLTKNTVTEANLCIIRNREADLYIIRGELNSKDKKEVESVVEVDFGAVAKVENNGYFTWETKHEYREEASFHPDELTLKFRQNTKGVRRSLRKIVVGCE